MKLGKSKIFLFFCLSFIFGVFVGKFLNSYVMAMLALFFIILLTLFWRSPKFMVAGFLGVTFLLGAWRIQAVSHPDLAANFIAKLYGQKVEISGIVVKDPDVRAKQTNLTITPRDYEGNVLITVGKYPEYQYGDELQIFGKVEEPFETEDFSYKNYLSRYDTYAVMRFPKVEKHESNQGSIIKSSLLAVKHKFQDVLSQSLPEPHNSLLLGIILGLKRSLPNDLKEALVICGISHIVVISGYNISIITKNLLKTRGFWGRRAAFIISLLAVLAFVIMSGAEASVLRAAAMGMLLVLALNVGRVYQVTNALVLTAALMIAQNPKILNFDIGFQLSFLATLGLIYLTPIFEKWLQGVPNFLQFRTNLASTMGAIIFTLPLLIYYFDRVSIVAPVVNVLILWTMPYLMFLGFVNGLVGMIYLPLAKLLGAVTWILLEYMIRVVEFFAHLPFSQTSAQIKFPVIFLYYLLLGGGIWIYRNKKKFYYQLEYVKVKI